MGPVVNIDALKFTLETTDPGSKARAGVLSTDHGDIQTPIFMPVGTIGTVRAVPQTELKEVVDADIILGNTYHLALRPGHATVRKLGGLHGMSGWEGPILTDSGGFQIFSLDAINKVTEEAATFRSHIDGSIIKLTPEHSIEIQEALGSDVAMVLDHVVALPAPDDAATGTGWPARPVCRGTA